MDLDRHDDPSVEAEMGAGPEDADRVLYCPECRDVPTADGGRCRLCRGRSTFEREDGW